MRIIYKTETGVAVIAPSPEWGGTLQALGEKDVPSGKKFKIVEDSVIPTDRSFRNAWEVDEDDLIDGVGV